MEPNTVKLHRVFKTTQAKLYRAFLDPAAMYKWLPPNGFTGSVDHVGARIRGTYKMSLTNFGTGSSHSFGCVHCGHLQLAVDFTEKDLHRCQQFEGE